VSHIRESLGLSERRACQLVDISSPVYWYRPKPGNDDVLRQRLRELAEQMKRFGSPRLHQPFFHKIQIQSIAAVGTGRLAGFTVEMSS